MKQGLLAPVVAAFLTNGDRPNLLNSALLELFDFVRRVGRAGCWLPDWEGSAAGCWFGGGAGCWLPVWEGVGRWMPGWEESASWLPVWEGSEPCPRARSPQPSCPFVGLLLSTVVCCRPPPQCLTTPTYLPACRCSRPSASPWLCILLPLPPPASFHLPLLPPLCLPLLLLQGDMKALVGYVCVPHLTATNLPLLPPLCLSPLLLQENMKALVGYVVEHHWEQLRDIDYGAGWGGVGWGVGWGAGGRLGCLRVCCPLLLAESQPLRCAAHCRLKHMRGVPPSALAGLEFGPTPAPAHAARLQLGLPVPCPCACPCASPCVVCLRVQ